MNKDLNRNCLAPPCGLYCGICIDNITSKECHGCGCKCGKCIGDWHSNHCAIYECASNKQIESCADCKDFPCTILIQFTNDPIWRTHLVCIENLRRRKKIGTDKWIKEQEEYFINENNRNKEIQLHQDCADSAAKLKQ
jgi:hypothetical protein